jgi:endonuclease YncB( thermonuclease family)
MSSCAAPMRRLVCAPVLAGLALAPLVGGLGAGPAGAITQEAEQVWETGVVQRVSDGDTVQVTILTATNPEMFAPATGQTYCDNRISGSGRIPAEGLTGCSVRLVAVQSAETAGHGTGPLAQCGAKEAESALTKALSCAR